MSRLDIKDAGVGTTLKNRRTGEVGSVVSVDADATRVNAIRVRLASGRRVTVRPDGSGEIRWQRHRREKNSR